MKNDKTTSNLIFLLATITGLLLMPPFQANAFSPGQCLFGPFTANNITVIPVVDIKELTFVLPEGESAIILQDFISEGSPELYWVLPKAPVSWDSDNYPILFSGFCFNDCEDITIHQIYYYKETGLFLVDKETQTVKFCQVGSETVDDCSEQFDYPKFMPPHVYEYGINLNKTGNI